MADPCVDDACFEDEVELMASSLLQSSLRRTTKVYSFLSGTPHHHTAMLVGAGCCLLAGILRFAMARQDGASVLAPMTSILLFVFWMSWYQYFSGDPFDAFVESMTYCPSPVPVEGRCPVGSSFHQGRCVPEPPSSVNWSLSAHCSDKNFVVGRAARINGLNASTSAAVGMLAVVFTSSYMERLGRKPVLVFFLVASIVVKLLLSLSCFAQWESFVALIVVQNIVEIASATPVYPALNCMIADLSKESQQVRGECYASLEAAKNVASLLALLSGYPVLRAHLTSYLPFWASLAGVSVMATLIFSWALPETLQLSGAKEVEAPVALPVLLWRSLTEGLRSCFTDVFLGQFLIIWGLINLAVNGAWGLSTMYLQSFLGVEQANASLCRAVWFLALFAGASLSAPLTKHCGAAPAFAASVAVMASSWLLCGLGGICPSLAQRLFWFFGVGTFGLAYGVCTPCFGILVAASAATPSVAFGASVVVGTLLGMPFGPMWSQFLFDPSATGLRAGAPWLASASLLTVTCAWFLAISRRNLAPRDATP